MLDLVNKLGQPGQKGPAMQFLEIGYKIVWLTVGGSYLLGRTSLTHLFPVYMVFVLDLLSISK